MFSYVRLDAGQMADGYGARRWFCVCDFFKRNRKIRCRMICFLMQGLHLVCTPLGMAHGGQKADGHGARSQGRSPKTCRDGGKKKLAEIPRRSRTRNVMISVRQRPDSSTFPAHPRGGHMLIGQLAGLAARWLVGWLDGWLEGVNNANPS